MLRYVIVITSSVQVVGTFFKPISGKGLYFNGICTDIQTDPFLTSLVVVSMNDITTSKKEVSHLKRNLLTELRPLTTP